MVKKRRVRKQKGLTKKQAIALFIITFVIALAIFFLISFILSSS